MDAAPPKPKQRRWPWVEGVALIVVSVAIWLIFPLDKIENGDAGYRRLLRYHEIRGSRHRFVSSLPRPLQEHSEILWSGAYSRYERQFDVLWTNASIAKVEIVFTNMPGSFSNAGALLPDDEIKKQLSAIVPDQYYHPIYGLLSHPAADIVFVEIFCRTKDVPAFQAAHGASNDVEVYKGPDYVMRP